MIIKRNISKQTISELPKAFFPGRIFVVQTETEAEKAVEYLSSQKVIGIDSTQVSWNDEPSVFKSTSVNYHIDNVIVTANEQSPKVIKTILR